MSFTTESVSISKDFLIEVGKGNIEGHSLRGIVMKNKNVSSTFVDLWGGTGDLVYPVANESWEVRSDSVNDTLGGTGSHSITQNYLDDNYIERSVTVDLDGTNWVTLNSDMFRTNGITALPSGSGRTNEGTITVRDVATLADRQVIDPGFSNSHDGHFTVPAGKTIFILSSLSFYPKNQDGFVKSKIMPFGTNTWIVGAELPSYQSLFSIDVKARLPFTEKTDLIFQGNSTNPNIQVSAILEIMIVENNFL